MNFKEKRVESFPFHKQKYDYDCGPAIIRMIFEFFNINISEDKIIKLCETSKKRGTSHEHIIEELKNENLKVIEFQGSSIKKIISKIDEGIPVVVNYFDENDNEGHYSIVIGYDKENLFFADPWYGNNYKINKKNFERIWHNSLNNSKKWMLYVTR